jgi:hypothetical protein
MAGGRGGTANKVMGELTTVETVDLLQTGTMELEGLVYWGSNYTFLVRVCGPGAEINAVYKPRKGERPLWDFPPGTLCLREQAAYLTSEALGWNLVPATVLRDGPHGWGSVQRFVEHDPDEHYFTFQGRYRNQLQKVVLFDLLVNNADRKGGHLLLDESGHIWSIDHGICFHTEYKLRTVIWEFAGEPIAQPLHADLQRFQTALAAGTRTEIMKLKQLLTEREQAALVDRLARLIAQPYFPQPGPGRHYPWPPV